jgi:Protein of unknown function (DUF2934)
MNPAGTPAPEGQGASSPPEQETPAVTDEAIAERAYELSRSEESGTPEENWSRAERELRGEQAGE